MRIRRLATTHVSCASHMRHARHTARDAVRCAHVARAYTPHTTRTLCDLSSWIKMHQRSWQPIPGTYSATQMLTAIAPSSTNTPTPAKTARNGFLLGPKPARQGKAVCWHAEAPPPARPAHRPLRHHRPSTSSCQSCPPAPPPPALRRPYALGRAAQGSQMARASWHGGHCPLDPRGCF